MRGTSITETPRNASNREIAIAVIADKLGIPATSVNDETKLGTAWDEILTVVTFKTCRTILLRDAYNTTAGDLFRQL
jgi:hypothetical protein